MNGRMSRKVVVLAGLFVAGAVGVTVAVAGLTASAPYDGPARVRIVQSHFVPDDTSSVFVADWHTHPGPAIVQVQEGTFKIYQGTCAPVVVQSGETFIEVPHVPVKAVSLGEIRWTTTLLLPDTSPPVAGGPPTVNPGC